MNASAESVDIQREAALEQSKLEMRKFGFDSLPQTAEGKLSCVKRMLSAGFLSQDSKPVEIEVEYLPSQHDNTTDAVITVPSMDYQSKGPDWDKRTFKAKLVEAEMVAYFQKKPESLDGDKYKLKRLELDHLYELNLN